MSTTTPNLGLTQWSSSSDQFSYTQLSNNWAIIDTMFPGGAVAIPQQPIQRVSSVPAAGQQGRLIYLTVSNSGYAADTILRDNGSSWEVVGPIEVLNAVPNSGNYGGRVIVLSAASGGFNAWDTLVYNGTTASFQKIGNLPVISNTSQITSPFAGQLAVMNTAAQGFDAWNIIAYTGSSWTRTETRGVLTGAALPGSPLIGQVFCLTQPQTPFDQYSVVRSTGPGGTWNELTRPPLCTATSSPTFAQIATSLASNPIDGFEAYYQADSANGINWHFRYNASSGSAFKWESMSRNPLIATGAGSININTSYTPTSVSLTAPRAGNYVASWSVNFANSTNPQHTHLSALQWGAVAPVDSESLGLYYNETGVGASMISAVKTLNANDIVTVNVRMGGTNTGTATVTANLQLQPIRIS